jgi:hypothetical protein
MRWVGEGPWQFLENSLREPDGVPNPRPPSQVVSCARGMTPIIATSLWIWTPDCSFDFLPSLAEGLRGVRATALEEMEISPSGLGLHWPRLDADIYLPSPFCMGFWALSLGSQRAPAQLEREGERPARRRRPWPRVGTESAAVARQSGAPEPACYAGRTVGFGKGLAPTRAPRRDVMSPDLITSDWRRGWDGACLRHAGSGAGAPSPRTLALLTVGSNPTVGARDS